MSAVASVRKLERLKEIPQAFCIPSGAWSNQLHAIRAENKGKGDELKPTGMVSESDNGEASAKHFRSVIGEPANYTLALVYDGILARFQIRFLENLKTAI